MKPVSPKRPELEGFSPGEDGYIFVAGVDLSTGNMTDIAGLTGNANKTNFTLQILSGNGTDVTGTWDVMNLTEFFTQMTVPPWIQDEIKRHAGEGACVINFTAPGETGVYKVTVRVNLSGTIETGRTSLGVQKIFVHGEPVSSDGRFSPMVSPQSNVTLRIMAFDPSTGTEVPRDNITGAGLIEVYSESANDIVTDRMENQEFTTVAEFKALKFYVNDSYLGFHHVKFWVNATLVDGTSTKAIGEGWFETRLYYIWAYPEDWRTFGSESDINITVEVRDSGFNAKSDVQVSVDEIRYGKNWEKVTFDTTSTTASGTTDANGTCTLSINPSSSLKSGWYDVRIKATARDNAGNLVTDYGRGWFEVRNFVFDVYPQHWEVKSAADINFTVNVKNFDGSNKTATVVLTKVIYVGSWENPQPPMVVDTPNTQQTINGTDTFTYTGDTVTSSSGGYEFIFEATSGGLTETTRAWVHCRPFVAWADSVDWNYRFGIGENMSIIVEAYEEWGGKTPHNINASETNITMVMKEGMWRAPYKTQEKLIISSVTQEEPNKVNITLNLTGWDQGAYVATIKVVDNESAAEVFTHFWFQVELASVGIPEIYYLDIPEGNAYTIEATFNVTQDSSQIQSTGDSGEWPHYNCSVAANSYVEHHIRFLTYCELWDEQIEFWALLNRTSPRTLYINYVDANFTDESAVNHTLRVGDNFTDPEVGSGTSPTSDLMAWSSWRG